MHSRDVAWIRDKLRAAEAADLADNVPDEVILSIAAQAEQLYASLHA